VRASSSQALRAQGTAPCQGPATNLGLGRTATSPPAAQVNQQTFMTRSSTRARVFSLTRPTLFWRAGQPLLGPCTLLPPLGAVITCSAVQGGPQPAAINCKNFLTVGSVPGTGVRATDIRAANLKSGLAGITQRSALPPMMLASPASPTATGFHSAHEVRRRPIVRQLQPPQTVVDPTPPRNPDGSTTRAEATRACGHRQLRSKGAPEG